MDRVSKMMFDAIALRISTEAPKKEKGCSDPLV
jgi:hypothetical protein